MNALIDQKVRTHAAAGAALETLSEQGYVEYSTDPWKVALTMKGQIYGLQRLTSEADWPEWLKASWELIRAQDERPCPSRLEPLVLAYSDGLSCAEAASGFAFDDWERQAIEKAASDIDRQLTSQYTGRHGKRLESLLVHIDPKLRLGGRDIPCWSLIKPLISLEVAVNGQSVKVPLVPTRPHPNKS